MSSGPRLRVEGIKRIDVLELREELPEGSVTSAPVSAAVVGGVHGEPVTVAAALVALSVPAVRALAAWLARRGVRTVDERELVFKRDADGSVTLTVRGRLDQRGGAPPDQSVIDAFSAQLEALLVEPDAPQ